MMEYDGTEYNPEIHKSTSQSLPGQRAADCSLRQWPNKLFLRRTNRLHCAAIDYAEAYTAGHRENMERHKLTLLEAALNYARADAEANATAHLHGRSEAEDM